MLARFVFFCLYFLSPLVVPDAHGEGKGGLLVEMAWFYLGIPLSTIIGALWPHTIGRLFIRSGRGR